MSRQRVVLPRLLLEARLADIATLGLATGIAAEADVSLVHALVRWRLVPADAVCQLLSDAIPMRRFDLDGFAGPLPVVVARPVCVRQRILPLWKKGHLIGLAMSDPTDDSAATEFTRGHQCDVERVLVDDDALDRALRRLLPVGDVGPKGASAQNANSIELGLRVVRGEPSGVGNAVDGGADETLRLTAAGDDDNLPSSVFTDRTVDMPMMRRPPPVAVGAPPAQLTQVAAVSPDDDDGPLLPTRQMPMPAASSLLFDPTIDVAGLAQGLASDDRTIPNDDMLFLMRVLIVAPEPARSALTSALSRRIKQLTCVALADADAEVRRRRYDEVLVVDPLSGVAGSQQLAALAASAKKGVVVVSANGDLGRLPGVRTVLPLPTTIEAICALAVETLTRSAGGEAG